MRLIFMVLSLTFGALVFAWKTDQLDRMSGLFGSAAQAQGPSPASAPMDESMMAALWAQALAALGSAPGGSPAASGDAQGLVQIVEGKKGLDTSMQNVMSGGLTKDIEKEIQSQLESTSFGFGGTVKTPAMKGSAGARFVSVKP